MKKFILLPAILVAIAFTSCTKDQIDPYQDSPEKAEARLAINTVSDAFLTGDWSVTNCINSNGDETTKYKDYNLGFATNNSIVAKQGISTGTIGKWVVSYIDGKTRVSFTFFPNTGLDALSGDWTMLDGSDSKKIPLQNVVEQKCYLTLTKL